MKVSANRIRAIQLKDFEAAFRTVVGHVAALVLVLSFRESGVPQAARRVESVRVRYSRKE